MLIPWTSRCRQRLSPFAQPSHPATPLAASTQKGRGHRQSPVGVPANRSQGGGLHRESACYSGLVSSEHKHKRRPPEVSFRQIVIYKQDVERTVSPRILRSNNAATNGTPPADLSRRHLINIQRLEKRSKHGFLPKTSRGETCGTTPVSGELFLFTGWT